MDQPEKLGGDLLVTHSVGYTQNESMTGAFTAESFVRPTTNTPSSRNFRKR